jgi:transketolase
MAFGCQVEIVDGHRFEELESAFSSARLRQGRPHVIIAETLRGKGLPSIESRADRWFCNFSHAEVASLLHELHTRQETTLQTGPVVVR